MSKGSAQITVCASAEKFLTPGAFPCAVLLQNLPVPSQVHARSTPPSACLSFPREAREHQHCFTSEGCSEPAHRLHGTRAAVKDAINTGDRWKFFILPQNLFKHCPHVAVPTPLQPVLPSPKPAFLQVAGEGHIACPILPAGRGFGVSGGRGFGVNGVSSPPAPHSSPSCDQRGSPWCPAFCCHLPGLPYGLSCLPSGWNPPGEGICYLFGKSPRYTAVYVYNAV